MKKVVFLICLSLFAREAISQIEEIRDKNLRITNTAAFPYGVNINHEGPSTLRWAREFNFSFNGNGNIFSFGAISNAGALEYGYIAGNRTDNNINYTNPWMLFLPNGNIGINVMSPKEKLEVNGNVKASKFIGNIETPNLFISPTGQLNGWSTSKIEYVGHHLIIGSKEGSYMHNSLMLRPGGASEGALYSSFSMYSAQKVGIYDQKVQISTGGNSYFNGGNVGIGTSNPQNKLDVAGMIRATEVKVEAGWADFVFDKDYKLPTLQDVENHINTHKHLPDIPSEKEVKENGVSLGEMQAKLLQKIEELTLYVIDLKKENEEQEKKMNEQNNKITELQFELQNKK